MKKNKKNSQCKPKRFTLSLNSLKNNTLTRKKSVNYGLHLVYTWFTLCKV